MEYGLIGKTLGHSYSKEIHEQIADYQYELKEIAPEDLDAFMKARDFKAINVTIPYKQDVIPYLDEIDENARRIGAVNTIVNRGGKLFGYNTDFAGMRALAERLGFDMEGKKVLILGSGGTARTAAAVAASFHAGEIFCVSRDPSGMKNSENLPHAISYGEAQLQHSDADFIINTTPCGMYPSVDRKPIDLFRFPDLEGVLDVIYNPLRSNLVLEAQELEIPAEGGLYMLAAQAVFACGHFLNREMRREDIENAYLNVRKQKRNIVLTGMPSCGKTTIGKKLSEMFGMKVIDTDDMVVKKIGMEIAEYAALCGETAFRDVESSAVEEASSESGVIIATGGGVVLRESNVRALKRNGVMIFIDRPLELLKATADRPFSADSEALKKRFEERYDIYCLTADHCVDGRGSVDEVAEIVSRFV